VKKRRRDLPQCRILNPLGERVSRHTAPAGEKSAGTGVSTPRLETVDDKTIYLVDVGFGGGYEFLGEMQRWFVRYQPRTATILRRKKGNMFLDDPNLWAEVKARGDAVILGVGG
jgi:hypothetical protein